MTDSTDTSETPLPPDMTVAMAIQRLVAARRQNRLDAESERITGHLDHIRMPYCAQAMARKVATNVRLRTDYHNALYGGPVPHAASIAEFDSIAKSLMPRMDFPLWIKNYFFRLRVDKSVNLQDWTDGLILAAARDQVARDMAIAEHDMDHLYHPEAMNVVNRFCDMPGPMVMLTSHFGPRMIRAYYTKEFIERVLIMRMKSDSQRFVWNNAREAAFAAMKTLATGGKILISPDGPMSERRVDIAVAGYRFDIALGTHVLAYENNAHVTWLHFETTENGFLPVFVDEGLRREPGETSQSFSTRFNAFYARMLEQRLTGPADQFLLLPAVRERLRRITT